VTGLRLAIVAGTVAGGTGQHAAMLARGCAAQGVSVRVLAPESARSLFTAGPGCPPEEQGPSAGPAPLFLPVEIGDRPRPVRDLAAVVRARRMLAGTDVVHAHGLRAGGLAAVATLALGRSRAGRGPARTPGSARRRARRAPALLVTVHNAAPPGAAQRAAYRILERIVACRADSVLCASADLADRMRRLGARSVSRAVVAAHRPGHRAPPPGEIERLRASLGAQGRPLVLAAGRLAWQKGYDVLLAAARRWQCRDPLPRLVIAGDGPLAATLAASIRLTGADVLLLGYRTDLPSLLTAADVVVVPSRWEARALIVQEAQLAGRPIVASRVGGISELTGAGGALLVPPGDPAALAGAVLAVLDDAGLAARLAEASRALAARLPSEADAVAAALAEYRRLAAGRSGAPAALAGS